MTLNWYLALTMTLLYPIAAYPIDYGEVAQPINELKNLKCAEPTSIFYSPNDSKCNIQSLGCAIQELDVVREECFELDTDNKQLISRTKDILINYLKEKNITENYLNDINHCFCGDIIVKTNYVGFLKNIQTQLQKLNSR